MTEVAVLSEDQIVRWNKAIVAFKSSIPFDLAAGIDIEPIESKIRAGLPTVDIKPIEWSIVVNEVQMIIGKIGGLDVTVALPNSGQPAKWFNPTSKRIELIRTEAALVVEIGAHVDQYCRIPQKMTDDEIQIAWQAIQAIEQHIKGM